MGKLLTPATEKKKVTAGEDKGSLGRVGTGEPYCMVRGVPSPKYPGVPLFWALVSHLQVMSSPAEETH